MGELRWKAGAMLVGMSLGAALLLAACATSDDSSDVDDDSTTGGVSIPAYTLQSESPADCAVENEDGSIEADANCHVHIVLNDTVASDHVRMKVEGTFLASLVYPLLFGSDTGASDGWVLQFWRDNSDGLNFQACDTESCTNGTGFNAFQGTFAQGDDFVIYAEADQSGGTDTEVRAWADTDPSTTSAGDLSETKTRMTFAGTKVGVSIKGAKITVIEVTENP